MHGLHTGHLADGVLDRNGPSRVELKPGGLHTHPPGCIGYNGQLDLGVNYSRHCRPWRQRAGRLLTDAPASLGNDVGDCQPGRLGRRLRAPGSAQAPLHHGHRRPANGRRTQRFAQRFVGAHPDQSGEHRPGRLNQ